MKQSKSEKQQPKPAKLTWSTPVLEKIEMHSTKGTDANRMTEMTLEQSLLAS